MEKNLNNNFVILGIRKLGENRNKETTLYTGIYQHWLGIKHAPVIDPGIKDPSRVIT
jgi:hypothetical protein